MRKYSVSDTCSVNHGAVTKPVTRSRSASFIAVCAALSLSEIERSKTQLVSGKQCGPMVKASACKYMINEPALQLFSTTRNE